MSNVTEFPTFVASYRKLVEQSNLKHLKIFIEFYHHDCQSEPFLVTEGHVDKVRMEEIEDHGRIINIVTKEMILSLTERNYYTNISNDTVVFSSKHDDETYCIIEFI